MDIFKKHNANPNGNAGDIDSPRHSQDPINPVTAGKFDPVNTSPKGMDASDASNDQRWSSMKNGGYYKK